MNDREMIEAIKLTGNEDLRDALIIKYRPLAMRVVYNVVGYHYKFDYEVLKNQALLELDQAVFSYDTKAPAEFSTYVYAIMKNSIINTIRKQRAQKRDMGDFSYYESSVGSSTFSFAEVIADEEEDPIKPFYEAVQTEFIKSTLKEQEYNLYILRLQGMSNAQISEYLNCSRKTVDNKITYIRRKLKKNQEVYTNLIK